MFNVTGEQQQLLIIDCNSAVVVLIHLSICNMMRELCQIQHGCRRQDSLGHPCD